MLKAFLNLRNDPCLHMKELNSNSLVIMLMQTKSIYINLSTRIDVRKKDRIQKQVSDLVVCQISV